LASTRVPLSGAGSREVFSAPTAVSAPRRDNFDKSRGQRSYKDV
jgi:hypothetical protein